jgi:hypothetical protein
VFIGILELINDAYGMNEVSNDRRLFPGAVPDLGQEVVVDGHRHTGHNVDDDHLQITVEHLV